jgi:hypothetical protein
MPLSLPLQNTLLQGVRKMTKTMSKKLKDEPTSPPNPDTVHTPPPPQVMDPSRVPGKGTHETYRKEDDKKPKDPPVANKKKAGKNEKSDTRDTRE